jgi:hypothetical protein
MVLAGVETMLVILSLAVTLMVGRSQLKLMTQDAVQIMEHNLEPGGAHQQCQVHSENTPLVSCKDERHQLRNGINNSQPSITQLNATDDSGSCKGDGQSMTVTEKLASRLTSAKASGLHGRIVGVCRWLHATLRRVCIGLSR